MNFELVVFCVGCGFIAFWGITWLSGAMHSTAEPWPGHHRHELTFAVPDCVLGVGLIASTLAAAPLARDLQLICAGALLFFAMMDLGYLALTWRLRAIGMRIRTAGLALIALMCSAMILSAHL